MHREEEIDVCDLIEKNRARGGSWEYEKRSRGGRIVLYLPAGTHITLTIDDPPKHADCWLDNAAGESIVARGHVTGNPFPVDTIADLINVLNVAEAVDTLVY
jgi:hypothetical protein